MRFGLFGLLSVVLALSACTAGGAPRGDSGPGFDTGTPPPDTGTGMDAASPRACMTDGDCDDTFACTVDQCAVGNVCRNTPLDEMCAEGERRSLRMASTPGSATAADCDNGQLCDGVERCIAGDCFMGDPHDCDDGNACTVDTCDTTENGCLYETAPGCDAGTIGTDAGTPCDPFDPSMHYTGSFILAR